MCVSLGSVVYKFINFQTRHIIFRSKKRIDYPFFVSSQTAVGKIKRLGITNYIFHRLPKPRSQK